MENTTNLPELYRHVIRFRFVNYPTAGIQTARAATLSPEFDARQYMGHQTSERVEIVSVKMVGRRAL
jgi:hypothetical protein